MVPRTFTRERVTRYGLPLIACVGLTLLRTHDITRTFWLFGDQILYWDSALLPFSQQPLAGPEQHVGGYALGPTYYYLCTSSNQFGPVSLFHKRDFLPVDRPARCA